MQVLLAYERLESGVAYNPLSDEVARDPYAVYRRLRDKDPVHRMRLVDAWVLTRYEHADAVLRESQALLRRGSPLSRCRADHHAGHRPARPHAAARAGLSGVSRRAR